MEGDQTVKLESESVNETKLPENVSVKREADEDVSESSVGANGTDSLCDTKKIKLEANNEETVTDDKSLPDPYGYIQSGGFTCEIYKIELGNLPKFVSYTCLKKFIEKKSQVKPHKMKMIKNGKKNYSFISFKSAEERDKAIESLDGSTWKNKTLFAKRANPAKDPFIKRRMEEESTNCKSGIDSEENINSGDKLNDKVCPLWKTPYEDQLKIKSDNYRKFLISLRRDIAGLGESPSEPEFNTIKWAHQIGSVNSDCICPLGEIKPSPVTIGYRNKCEFSIGPGKVIGFRLGLYKEGSVQVIFPPENCPIVSPKVRKIISTFQDYLLTSDQNEFDNVNHEGFWRQVTVRATELGAMVMIAVHPQNRTIKELDEEKEKIKQFFIANRDKCEITSLFFHPFVTRDKTVHDSSELQLVDGEPFIFESLRQNTLIMKISPFAFWQTNTAAAEICYSTIEQLAQLNENSIVLDICCGTGSIGIYLANKVKHVIGLELNHDALEDARYNAEHNKITNIEFIEGKAEDEIDSVLKRAFDKFGDTIDLTAIIDPPRAGLHPSVIKTIRSTPNIKKLVYVSCEPKLARKNLIDLSRPRSNAYKGIPFVPTSAIPIDMFPHTVHCELLLLYQRMDTLESSSNIS
ncbi:tRNA (uracil-5-)-methyltransferase homolog A-like [Panonychus citri]|uniref:tRNA (uracil-5-)-methyltransferase homolog A-like n=1 Tax=Panonychus citri TaxID=50023 RepID=UPI002306EB00|nr:tRNA (uracil-5-)-methyltransferase homolog A-like [Panonychus citri]